MDRPLLKFKDKKGHYFQTFYTEYGKESYYEISKPQIVPATVN
jgi:hypothetical protein